MRPNRSTAVRTAAAASAPLVTSSLTASTSFDPPRAVDTRRLSRPDATTRWPVARAALAISTPRPRPAPVMNQTFLLLMRSPLPSIRHLVPGFDSWYNQLVLMHAVHECDATTSTTWLPSLSSPSRAALPAPQP